MMNRVARVFGLMLLVVFGANAAAEDYPQGCVSCHTNTDDGDMRLNHMLQRVSHSMAGQRTLVIPDGCDRCHADADSIGGALSTLVHRAHYEDPVHEKFVNEFNGECRSCHAVDYETGKIGVKSGERNWQLRIAPPE
ncbi:MAG: hypothetical protein WBN65_13325 [Gammaproteobacteria bacterium]